MKNRRVSLTAVLAAGLAVGSALLAPAHASDTLFGVRTGVYTDTSAGFLGGEIVTPIAPAWYFNPNLEYAFANDRDVLTVNGDFHYDFIQDRPYYVWAGAGPAVVVREFEPGDRRTDLGLNLFSGIGWKNPPQIKPYLQGKVLISDNNEAVLAFGMRF